MNSDFNDMFSALSVEGVEYLVVGAYALAAHGLPRATVLTAIDGVEFAGAWTRRETHTVDGIALTVIGRDDLIKNKRATGRTRDLADAEQLEGTE